MIITNKQAALLRDVVQCIIDSGYAELPSKQELKRTHIDRREQIEVLSHDPRISNSAYKSEMTTYVMVTYNVTYNNAKIMLCRARRAARAQKSAAG